MGALRVALALGVVVGAWAQLANAAPPRAESARAARSYAVPLAITYGTSIGSRLPCGTTRSSTGTTGRRSRSGHTLRRLSVRQSRGSPPASCTRHTGAWTAAFLGRRKHGLVRRRRAIVHARWLSLLSKDHPSRDNGYLGTSGRAGAIVLLSAGYLGQALWAFDDVSRRSSLASGVPRSAQRLALRQISVLPTRSGATLVAVGGF